MGQTAALKSKARNVHAVTRITATIEATGTVDWPHFAGSTLRGAFGRALRRAACVTGNTQCQGCALRGSCAYGAVFDPAPPPHPLHPSFRDGQPRYLIQPPALGARRLAPGDTRSFSILLLPGAQTHQSFIEHTLTAAVQQQLMQAGQFTLRRTQTDPLPAPAAASPGRSCATQRLSLQWLTPLRLQVQGRPLFSPRDLDAPLLVRALTRRHLQWSQLAAQAPRDLQPHLLAAQRCTLDVHNLQWHDLQRHSGTQQKALPLGGLLGRATLHGPADALQTLYPLLQLGEMIQIGKETVMGLGRYQIRNSAD